MATGGVIRYRNCQGWADPISQTGPIVITKRPVVRYSRKKTPRGESIMICPLCGHEDDCDGWDVIGADDGCLFCNQCGTECAT